MAKDWKAADMQVNEVGINVSADLLRRLRKIEGQARGIQRMIEEDRSCKDILYQLAAMRAAVNRAGLKMIGAMMADCLRESLQAEGANCSDSLETAVATFLKFSDQF